MGAIQDAVSTTVRNATRKASGETRVAAKRVAKEVAGAAQKMTFDRMEVGLAVGQTLSAQRLRPIIDRAGQMNWKSPAHFNVLQSEDFKLTAMNMVSMIKELNEERHIQHYLVENTARVFGKEDPLAEAAYAEHLSMIQNMQRAGNYLYQMLDRVPKWVRGVWMLAGFDADAFLKKHIDRLGPKGLDEIPGFKPEPWK